MATEGNAMFLYAFDVYLCYPTFTTTGKLLFPLNDQWQDKVKCDREVEKQIHCVITANINTHGLPNVGMYLEIKKLDESAAEFPWYAFMLRCSGKPCVQWSTVQDSTHIISESELLNGEG